LNLYVTALQIFKDMKFNHFKDNEIQ